MPLYRKKPLVVEARQLGVDYDEDCNIVRWCGGRVLDEFDGYGDIAIDTLEGTMIACNGDWIIRGVKGGFYPCKPEIFQATYELVTESQGTVPA